MKTFCKLTAQSPAASYVPLPRFLLQDEALRDISNDAKVLYALLLDRASISRQNGYVEPDGTIRLYFTLEQAQTCLLYTSPSPRDMRRSRMPSSA